MTIEEEIKNLVLQVRNSRCSKELEKFSESQYLNVRQEVARNKNTSITTLQKMVLDKTQNVFYDVVRTRRIRIERDYTDLKDVTNKCLLCTKDLLNLDCSNCNKGF